MEQMDFYEFLVKFQFSRYKHLPELVVYYLYFHIFLTVYLGFSYSTHRLFV
jgi:hypothetical protein